METEFNHIANELSSHTYIMKPYKNYGTEAHVASWLLIHINVSRGWRIPKAQNLHIWDPPDLPPVSLHLAACDVYPS